MSENNEVVKSLLAERIKQRSENVAINAEQRRAEREINASETENADFFFDNFQIMKENIEFKLQNIKNQHEIINFLDEIVKDISNLQTFLNESSMFLPSFQIKKAQESINILNESIQSSILEIQPKKKFGFKNKPINEMKSSSSLKTEELKPKNSYISDEIKEKSFFGFKDISNETLKMSADEVKSRQLQLLNLVNCKVIILGNPSSLQFCNLKDTTVLIGPTSRSALIKNCHNSNFVLACQQVRIHNCKETQFYLHVTCSAIIEDCQKVFFGPYTLEYPEKEEHFVQSGLSLEHNNWNKIEDFLWLNEREKSPNFTILPPNEWKKDWL